MKTVVIIGGGASGILVATHLATLAKDPIAVTIAEPSAELGCGVAYGTDDESHLLNVPAGRMSAFPSDPSHFRTWAKCQDSEFISRRRYGRYLLETFLTKQSECRLVSFRHERTLVTRVERRGENFLVTAEDGPMGKFDVVVLSTGHGSAFNVVDAVEIRNSPRFVSDPWRDVVPLINGVLVSVGTGLTFIDLALSHLRRNQLNRVFGVSRTGQLPKQHLPVRAAPLAVPDIARKSPSELRRFVEESDDWRAAQDGIRHVLPDIWYSWSEAEKSEFWTQHLRWWNVHRHRMAPELADEVREHIGTGRLNIVAAKDLGFIRTHQGIRVLMDHGEIDADLVVNSTGYGSLERTELADSLFDSGLISRAPLGLGVRSNFPSLELLDHSGNPTPRFFGIGPILLGERLETTAIPEIREQAMQIALSIVAA